MKTPECSILDACELAYREATGRRLVLNEEPREEHVRNCPYCLRWYKNSLSVYKKSNQDISHQGFIDGQYRV